MESSVVGGGEVKVSTIEEKNTRAERRMVSKSVSGEIPDSTQKTTKNQTTTTTMTATAAGTTAAIKKWTRMKKKKKEKKK